MILSFFGRAILLLISLKRLSICKVYVYYNFLASITLIGLPSGDSLEASISSFTNNVNWNIVANYFHFSSSIICMLVVQILFFMGRVTLVGETFDGKLIMTFVFTMVW